LLLCSCNDIKIQDSILKSYNIEQAYGTEPIGLCLDSISSDISLIHLETSDDILIQQIIKIYLYHDLLFVLHVDRCSVFDMNGKYLYDIGKSGNGPGEYLGLPILFFSENYVYVFSRMDCAAYCYTIDGKFIFDYKFPKHFDCIRNIKDDIFAGYIPVDYGDYINRLLFFNMEGNIIDSTQYNKIFPEGESGGYFFDDGNMFVYNNKICIKEGYYDTIFSIRNDFKLIPEYIITTGKYSVNYDDRRLDIDKYQKGKRAFVYFESDHYIIVNVFSPVKSYIMIDKKTDKVEHVLLTYNEEMAELFEDDGIVVNMIDFKPTYKNVPSYFHIRGVSEDGKIALGYEILKKSPEENPVIVMARIN